MWNFAPLKLHEWAVNAEVMGGVSLDSSVYALQGNFSSLSIFFGALLHLEVILSDEGCNRLDMSPRRQAVKHTKAHCRSDSILFTAS